MNYQLVNRAQCDHGSLFVQSISRAALVLRLIGNRPRPGAAFSDIMRLSKLPRATVHRLLKSLENEGFVYQDDVSRHYRIGPLAYELGLVADSQLGELECCQQVIDEASQAVGNSVSVLSRSGDDVVCVLRSASVTGRSSEIGIRRPIGVGAGGIAILSALREEEREAIIARHSDIFQSYGGLTEDSVRRAVDLTQERGFSVRQCGGIHRCIGVVVGTATGRNQLALKSGPISFDIPRDEVRQIAQRLKRAAIEAERRLSEPRRPENQPALAAS